MKNFTNILQAVRSMLSGKRNQKVTHPVTLFLIPLLLVVLSESIQRNSIWETLQWMAMHPLMFLVNYLLILSVYLLLFVLPKMLYFFTVALFSLACFLFSYVHQVKLSLRGEPFLPADLYLFNEAEGISGAVSTNLFSILFLCVSILAMLYLIFQKYPKYGWKSRVLLGICSVVIVSSLTSDALYSIRDRLGIRLIPWNQVENVKTNGFSYSFLNNYMDLQVDQPFTYNQDEIQTIIDKTSADKSTKPKVKPNVIMIMSEAFFDPTILPNVQFERDPLPTVHQLAKTHNVGNVSVSVFGGGTANSEFEALTGLAVENLPVGSMAYSQYVYRPIDGLPSIMKRNGYHTTAIHPFYHWYYNRTHVYQNLGFDRFIPMEFMTAPETKGPFIRDSEVAKRILAETQKTDGQDFVFAVTMQSHGPYDDQNLEISNHVSGSLSESGKKILGTYATHLEDTDRMLKTLIDEFKARKEPTVIVMYGDHFPMLGSDYQVYRESSFITDIYKQDDFKKMHQTPLVVWDNIGLKKEDVHMQLPFLGAFLVDRLGLDGNATTHLLMQAYDKKIRFLSEKFSPANAQTAAKDKLWKKDYELIWYDILFGDQYAYQLGKKPSVNPDYGLGSEDMVLEKADPLAIVVDPETVEEDQELPVTIQGKHFEGTAQVSVNDTMLPTTYLDQEHVSISLPASFLKEKELTLSVKVLNERGDEIAKSENDILIPILNHEEFKQNSKVTSLADASLKWELFSSDPDFTIVRAKLPQQTAPYLVANKQVDLQDNHADAMNAGNQSDIYPNGYLYISIANHESGWKPSSSPSSDAIRQYLAAQDYRLYQMER
ncbi:LTA synthase family protein [Brevibacillus migulae]|uniref:LTA synthase family protein n=1 Tax=Brevibacillus migulae TaxID=1644114 RepID=UPI00106EA244|nr:LTA synthase family protein [Brevibacillus migulae]